MNKPWWDIIEALFFILSAIWGLLYYTGRLYYAGDQEKRRKRRVEKYGWIILMSSLIGLVGGMIILIFSFYLVP